MSTTMRRRRNDIYCLKDASNQWDSNPLNIQNQFLDHFKKVYQTTTTQPPEVIEELFLDKISQLDNNFLCSIPTEEEILSTIKKISYSQASSPNGFTGVFFFKKILGHCQIGFQ